MAGIDAMWGYCGQRAADRNSTKDERVHAVGLAAKLSGAMDAECGVIGVVPVGDWNPDRAHACPDCVRALAAPAVALAAPDGNQLSLFAAA